MSEEVAVVESEDETPHSPSGESSAEETGGIANRYLTFELAEQFYGIELASVQEIVRSQRVTPVPDVPHFVRGVINLRGTVVPVVDVRRRMNMEPQDPDERTCVIVCSFRGEGIGLVVDTVCDVVRVKDDDIVSGHQARAESGATDEMIRGLVRMEDGVKILIELDQMLRDPRELETASAA